MSTNVAQKKEGKDTPRCVFPCTPSPLLPRNTTVPEDTIRPSSEDQPIVSTAQASQFIPLSTLLNDPYELSKRLYLFPVPSLNSRSRPLKSTPSRLFRKLTRRFKTPILPPKSANPETASPPRSPTQLSNRRSQAVPIASGDVAAVMRRQAALHQCGLVPLPRKDLSQLEADLDRRFTRIVVLPDDQQDSEEMTTAEKIRKEWQAKNEALPEKQGDDGADPTDPNRFPSESSNAERLEQSDPMGNVEERMTPELTVPPSPDPLVNPESPVPLSPIPETFSIPEVPEEDVAPSENEKVRHLITFNGRLTLINIRLYRKPLQLALWRLSTLFPSPFLTPPRLPTCPTCPHRPLLERVSDYHQLLSA